MIIAILGAVINVVLDVVLVYGIEGVLEPMNIKGAAYARVFSQFIMALCSAYFLLKKTIIPLKINFPFNQEIKRFVLMILNLFVRTIALNVLYILQVHLLPVMDLNISQPILLPLIYGF